MPGFTLIELLIVIAIIGIMAALVLVAVNPAEYFKRADDSERKGAIKQLWESNERFLLEKGSYVGQDPNWDPFEGAVGASGTYKDLRQIPKPKDCPTNGTSWKVEQPPCGYKNGGGNFVVMYSELKSQAERKSAIAAHVKDGINTPCLSNYWVFTATNSKYGYICADAFGNLTPVATNIARFP